MTVDEASSFAKNNAFDFDTFGSEYEVTDLTNWKIILNFGDKFLSNVDFYNSGNGEHIIISNTKIISFSEKGYEEYGSLAECEQDIFGEISGIEFTVEKDETSSSSVISSYSSSSSPSSSASSYVSISLRHGKLLDKKTMGTSLIIKAKIEPSYNNKATVNQNYYNIENIIKNQGGSKFKEIQYWAVADMTNGSEQKVISFTVPEDVIKKIANGQIVANQMGKYVDDLFIHASLR